MAATETGGAAGQMGKGIKQRDKILEAVGRLKERFVKARAFVVLKPGRAPSQALAEELKSFVKACLAPHKYPRTIEFLPELPKTATGKIQRFRLRELQAAAAPH